MITKIISVLVAALAVLSGLLGLSRNQAKKARQSAEEAVRQRDEARHIANTQSELAASQHRARQEAAAHEQNQKPTDTRPTGAFGDDRLHKD